MLSSTLAWTFWAKRRTSSAPKKFGHYFLYHKKSYQSHWTNSLPNRKAFKILTQIHFQKKDLSKTLDKFPSPKSSFQSPQTNSLPKKKAFTVFGQFPFQEKKNFQFLYFSQSANKVWEFSLRKMILTYSKELVLKSRSSMDGMSSE
jgi:uracil DNA glycosylase